MAGIPGGFEESSDEDGELMCFNFTPQDSEELARKINSEGNLRPLDTTSRNSSKHQNGHVVKSQPSVLVPVTKSKGYQPMINSVVVDDLRMAAVTGNLSKIQEVLETGLDVDTILKSGWTCLMYACSRGHFPIVKYLLEQNANPNYQKDMFTPLLAVCASRQDKEEELLQCLKVLLEFGAKTNIWDRHHMTSLMYCARENRINMLQAILEQNVEVDRQDNRGWTALFWAASNGHGQSVRILLEGGADPSKLATDGQSAADVAYTQKYEEIGDILERIRGDKAAHLNENEKESLTKCFKGQKKCLQDTEKTKDKQFTMYGELEMFLSGMNLSEYIPLFHEHQISFYDFLLLTEDDLEKMGVTKVGVKKNILEGIKTIHIKKWEKTSLPNLKKQQYISCPDAVAVMANISSHLRYIKSTVRYLRNEIQKTPRILELGQEATNVHKLIEESADCLRNERVLFDELRFFKLYLEKVQDRSEYQPADFIVETVPEERQTTCRLSRIAIISMTIVFGVLVWRKPKFLTQFIVIPQKWHWPSS